MLKNINKGLVLKLVILHVFIVTTVNYKIQFTGTVSGYHCTLAMFIFPLAMLTTDLTIRLFDKYNARVIVGISFIPAILISTLLVGWRIGLESGTTDLVGQLIDISIFQKI